jgi:hypothetical protein
MNRTCNIARPYRSTITLDKRSIRFSEESVSGKFRDECAVFWGAKHLGIYREITAEFGSPRGLCRTPGKPVKYDSATIRWEASLKELEHLCCRAHAVDAEDLSTLLSASAKHSLEHTLLIIEGSIEAWPGIETYLSHVSRFDE